jgi:hypothetical protein
MGGYGNKNQKQQVVLKREKRLTKPGTQKTVKQLLGELYADKVYLEKLLDDDRKLYSNKDNKLMSHHSNAFFFNN